MDIITDQTPGQGRQPRGGRDTRQRLIEAAREVFADRGYHAASLSEIASRAGLTTGAVYSTFGSKKALLIAAVTDGSGEEGDLGAMLAAAASLREGLEHLALDAARNGLDPASLRLIKLQVEVLKLGLDEPEVLAGVAAVGRQQLDAAEKALAGKAEGDGVPLPMPARDLVTLLSALLNGLHLMQLVDPSVVNEDHFLSGVRALLGWER
ncbi:MAG TPA: helix-turn-helix domain-containing protein [Candidatus Dormibacteraeota bacterium]|nr:helix-turn-helix domain-containing protein [Candidatus Dormibacteraeota bacterium]